MKDVEKMLNVVSQSIEEYGNMKQLNGDRLNELLQKTTAALYFLEEVRSDIHRHYTEFIVEKINEGTSVARAEAECNKEYPLMYQLRRMMEAGYRCTDSMRTNISYLKTERKSNENQN